MGEQALLPTVRQAAKDTLIIAAGFSCREQIAQLTDRQALHLAQVMQMALHQDSAGLPEAYPATHSNTPAHPARAVLEPVALAGIGILAGSLWLWGVQRARR